jgi:hypothetical protein
MFSALHEGTKGRNEKFMCLFLETCSACSVISTTSTSCRFQLPEGHPAQHQPADIRVQARVLNVNANQPAVFVKVEYDAIRDFVTVFTGSFSQVDI